MKQAVRMYMRVIVVLLSCVIVNLVLIACSGSAGRIGLPTIKLEIDPAAPV